MRRASVLWRTSASAGVVSGARAARTLSSRERGRQSLGERLGLHQLDAPRASTLTPWTRRLGAASEGTTPQLGPPTGENLGRRPEGALGTLRHKCTTAQSYSSRVDVYACGRAFPDSGSPRSAFRKASNAMSRMARTRMATSSSRSSLSSVASAIPTIEASGDPRRYL
jgi:hypothetical protein